MKDAIAPQCFAKPLTYLKELLTPKPRAFWKMEKAKKKKHFNNSGLFSPLHGSKTGAEG